MHAVILVPVGSAEERHGRRWGFAQSWLKHHHREYPVFVGDSPNGVAGLDAAIGDAAVAAGWWDVAVICDSATVVPPLQLETAVHEAHVTGLPVSAMTRVVELSGPSTERLLVGGAETAILPSGRSCRRGPRAHSVVMAVPRTSWEASRSFDWRFAESGHATNFGSLAAALLGGLSRAPRSAGPKPLRVNGLAFRLSRDEPSRTTGVDLGPAGHVAELRSRHALDEAAEDFVESVDLRW